MHAMTVPPTPTGPGRRVPLAVALIVVPILLAPVFMVVGLFGSLVWVYLSIGLSVLWVPCVVVGFVLLARGRSAGNDHWSFNPPPGWPRPPAGWVPETGWAPDPSWPSAPVDWQWWSRSTTTRR